LQVEAVVDKVQAFSSLVAQDAAVFEQLVVSVAQAFP